MIYLNAHFSALWGFYGLAMSVLAFCNKLDLKSKYKA